ncbi:MAG: exo-alpha-sialidase [Cyclobacteriaceae bacterium]|nr:exo-alpha-sialidase [Cyclobacteriaceae bacterium]
MNKICYLLSALVLLSFCAIAQHSPLQKDVFVSGTDGYHTYRIPALVAMPSGTLLAFCEGRRNNHEDTGDIDLLLKRSKDGGRTWSRAQVVHEQGGDSSITIGNPCPILDTATQRIHLLFVQDYHRLFSIYSDDEGSTWSAPQEHTAILDEWDYPTVLIATGPGHGLQLSTGRLVAPVWICDRERVDRYQNTTKDRIRAGMIYSDDKGQTWQAGGLVPAEIAMLHECTIVERKDGSLLINMRARSAGYRAVATSTDGGLTWNDPKLDKQLPDPTVQGSMITLSSDTILFSNPAVSTTEDFSSVNRKNLTLRMSTDGGEHWTYARTITEGPSAYSDLAIAPNGQIMCLYENGKENYRAKISFISVDKNWLLGGQK